MPNASSSKRLTRAVAAEQELHRYRADEGRHDQRDEAERLDERRAAKDEARGKIGERQRENRGQHDRHGRDIERVPKGTNEQVGAGEVGEIDERERTRALLGEGDVDHRRDRQDQEEQQEERDTGRGQDLAGRRGDSRRGWRESADRHVSEPARVSARASALPRPWLSPARNGRARRPPIAARARPGARPSPCHR